MLAIEPHPTFLGLYKHILEVFVGAIREGANSQSILCHFLQLLREKQDDTSKSRIWYRDNRVDAAVEDVGRLPTVPLFQGHLPLCKTSSTATITYRRIAIRFIWQRNCCINRGTIGGASKETPRRNSASLLKLKSSLLKPDNFPLRELCALEYGPHAGDGGGEHLEPTSYLIPSHTIQCCPHNDRTP